MKFMPALLLGAAVLVAPDARYFQYERAVLNMPQNAGQACLAIDAKTFHMQRRN